MIIIYLVVVCVVWISLKSTTNYKALLFCRRFLDASFYFVCILYSVFIVLLYSSLTLLVGDNPEKTAICWSAVIGIYCMLPLLFRFWKWLFHIKFYHSSHIKNLEKFILYLRSFKDDKKKTLTEYKLMDFLSKKIYVPFAVGRPNEMKPSSHTIPLYIGDDWKNKVEEMMQKAPLILLRVSDTEHFLWELGTCITQKHFLKSLFWVTDPKAYMFFKKHCFETYGLSFPEMENISKNCVVYLHNNEFQVYHLSNKKSYKAFSMKIFEVFNLKTDDYFFKRNKKLSLLFRLHYDKKVSIGIQRWDWTAFFFPEFYLMFHHFGWMRLYVLLIIEGCAMASLFLLCVLLKLSLYSLPAKILIWTVVITSRLLLMYLCGKNARTIEWYEEKWESVSYFNKISYINNIKTLAYALVFIVLCLLGLYPLLMADIPLIDFFSSIALYIKR